MRVLLDSNFLISAEPTHAGEVEENADVSQAVLRCIQQLKWEACVHPAQQHDFDRDRQKERVDLRRLKFQRYTELRPPFHVPAELAQQIAGLTEGSNDWVDFQLLAALKCGAVDYLVSDDGKLHKRAAKLGVADAVFAAQDALVFLTETLGEIQLPKLPAVEWVKAYALDDSDPIFDSLRADYPGFDAWLQRCRQQHRDAMWIKDQSSRKLAGLAIVKREDESEHGLPAGSLKVCTFKVADGYAGHRYGELLLRAVFEYAEGNGFRDAFVTVLPRHELLVLFLEQFGFRQAGGIVETGEDVYAKPFGYPGRRDDLDPFEVHELFGPSAFDLDRSKFFIVPIMPKWFSTLFPDCDEQKQLIPGAYPCGNAISKAYLSNTVTSKLKRGDNLLFYRSLGKKDVPVVGVVEDDPLRSSDPEELAKYVGKRTVYSLDQIRELAQGEPVLAIRFRHALRLKPSLKLEELKNRRVLVDYPQTLQEVRSEGLPWLKSTLKERFYCPSGPSTPMRS